VVNNYAAVWREGFERSYLDPRMRAIFEETLRAARPDVVHLQHLVTLSSDLALAARAAGVGCVLTLHDFWPLCQRGNLVDWGGRSCGGPEDAKCAACVADQLLGAGAAAVGSGWLARARTRPWFAAVRRLAAPLARAALRARQGRGAALIARRQAALRAGVLAADLLLTPSRYLRARYAAHGFPAERIVVSPIGFPPPSRPPRPRGPAGRPLRVGFIGRLTPIKGLHLLVQAVRTLPPDRYTLTVHGSWSDDPIWPTYRRDLERLAGGTATRFAGAFPPGGAPAALAALDVLVLPSLAPENAPLVVQEAKLAGVAVIGAEIGGVPELIVPGRDGWLVPPGDAGALAEVLRGLIEEPERLAALAPDAASVRTLADELGELEEHYQRLAAQRAAPAR